MILRIMKRRRGIGITGRSLNHTDVLLYLGRGYWPAANTPAPGTCRDTCLLAYAHSAYGSLTPAMALPCTIRKC